MNLIHALIAAEWHQYVLVPSLGIVINELGGVYCPFNDPLVRDIIENMNVLTQCRDAHDTYAMEGKWEYGTTQSVDSALEALMNETVHFMNADDNAYGVFDQVTEDLSDSAISKCITNPLDTAVGVDCQQALS